MVKVKVMVNIAYVINIFTSIEEELSRLYDEAPPQDTFVLGQVYEWAKQWADSDVELELSDPVEIPLEYATVVIKYFNIECK